MNARRLFGRLICRALLAGLLVCAGATVSAQSAGRPMVTPPSLREGVATVVTVRAQINAANLIAGSVNVQQVGPTGQATVLGLLNDNGSAGDLTAGDRIYSGQVVVNQANEGTIGLRVSFASRGSLRRTLSPVATLAVVPLDAPVLPAAVDLAAITTEPNSGARIVGARVNACFIAGTPYATVKAVGNLAGATPVGAVADLGNCFQLRLAAPDGGAVAAAVALLGARAEVLYAEPEFALAKQDSCVGAMCTEINYTRVLGLPAAHNLGEGANVVIGVLDSGLDAAFLAGSPTFPNVILGSNFVSPGATLADDTAERHGTIVAAIAQATAPKSQLFIAKVLNASGDGSESLTLAGMREAALAGATVLNLSQGSRNQSLWMRDAIALFQSAQIIIVAAAGNDASSTRVFPAAHLNVIAVGNVDQTDLIFTGPTGSNFGFWVNIAAPGVAILQDAALSGTSLSAPWVSGTVALMLGKYGAMTTAQVRDQLFRTALPIPANPGQDTCPAQPCNQDLGSGRLDPGAALGAIRLKRVTSVGASAATIPRAIDVSVRTGAGTTIFQTTMSFLGQKALVAGQPSGCQVSTVANPPCIATIPFDFAALPAGTYQLRLSFAAQAASFFGEAQLTAPGARFTSVAVGTGNINAADTTRAEYSLFGAGTSRTTIFNIVKP